MKRMNFLPMGAAALLLAFVACTDEIAEVPSGELRQIVMTASDFEAENGSRTNFQITGSGAEFSWAANDTVGIFPNEGAQAYFPMTSGAGTKTANFTGGGWALKDASTYAAYYPFIGSFYLDKTAIPVDYTGQVQTGDASTVHLGAYDYMAAAPSTPKNGNVSFAFKHLGALVQLKLTVPQPTTLNSVALTAGSNVFTVAGKVNVMANEASIKSTTSAKEVTLEVKNIVTTQANQVVTLYLMIPPTDLTGKTLKAVVKTGAGSEEVALDSKNFLAGKAYALSGSLKDPNGGAVAGNGTYKDGVVSIATAGTMKKLLGDDYLNITSLKVVGPINGDDVYYLRKMLGGNNFSAADWGKLATLDLSEATIVEGGEWYYEYSSSKRYYTSNNEIGYYMFYKCANLQNISLPDNITSIGGAAFCYCDALKSIDIPEGVTSISSSAFRDCKALTSVSIPASVNSIINAFGGCSSLEDVYITDIAAWCDIDFGNMLGETPHYGSKMYLNNKLITELIIPEGVTEIKNHAFEGLESITKVIIPNSVTSIGEYAFYKCTNLASIEIPNSVTSMGEYAFRDCESLTSVTIGDGLSLIPCYAFYGCILSKVILGKGIKEIEEWAFGSARQIIEWYCYATTPPNLITKGYNNPFGGTIYVDAFDNASFKDSKLYVPERCGSAYKTSEWSRFKNIIEMD